ncbi:bifunctional riboflavin kinase/FAD synthetase [Muricauda sp. SCSIO 64092]|uniref:bifunctional riboflavin kinase/FAD synthetase n=1 Tax=Allomuricauda sp. SCSIO 64092 TaxID=2908842 RepID=UPI001FF13758|nr:bifunctional riboflavin kinase/FAD synthetase [Muricauda sp. SCSIO 64092]UOY08396.1 bifunctional riboflavin kinase/FAD synthetase [Muricauda sp. SCSIO 64092]
METIQGISQFNSHKNTAITIGTFDGVHIGHKRILERLINNAKNTGTKSTVLTFFPHPRMVLQKDSEIKLLNTLAEKQQILREMGLDFLIVHPFTKAFSRLTALEFVRDLLVNKLKVKSVVIGYDHRFGRNRNANIKDLIGFGNTFDFKVEEIPAQEIDEVSVSSTKIRNALLNGDIETANAYLGYKYMLSGKVVRGKGLGKDLGFPTANLKIEEAYKLIPQNGAYIITCEFGNTITQGMMNIGYNPTVDGKNKNIEVHLFNVDQDLYNKDLQIRLIKKIRDEQKFDSLQSLSDQLRTDKENALEFLKNEIY